MTSLAIDTNTAVRSRNDSRRHPAIALVAASLFSALVSYVAATAILTAILAAPAMGDLEQRNARAQARLEAMAAH